MEWSKFTRFFFQGSDGGLKISESRLGDKCAQLAWATDGLWDLLPLK